MKRTLAILILAALAGCSSLNSVGIGGEPRAACSFRTGRAFIDDRLVGSDRVSLAVARRFPDGDQLCVPLKTAKAASAP